MKAAEASLCANEQGRFWQMHDSLFGFQQDLTVDSLKLRARELNLDTEAFNACLDSGRQALRVRKDMEEGAKAGVSGTPTLFVNGKKFKPSGKSFGDVDKKLRNEIDKELKK